jgi:3-phenylpropionate/cinnamic acid dioxygenase small subunit
MNNQQFQDSLAIVALLNNYILSIDSHNNEEFADNFSEEGIYDSPWGVAEGREAIIENISYWHSSGITKGKRHFMGAYRILEITENEARTESNYWIAEAETSPGIVATGFYIDTLKKVDGVWKIAHRKQVVDSSFKMNG